MPDYCPVLIDVMGEGFKLRDARGGVYFDLNGDGELERLAWTMAGASNALLALDLLSQSGISGLELDYKVSRRTDQYGNRFRYRAKVWDIKGEQVGRWAWDVFLVSGQ